MLFYCLRYVEGDVALGLAQADEQKQRRLRTANIVQPFGMLARVAPVRLRMPAASCLLQLAEVAGQIPATSDAQDLHVGFKRFQRAHQREHACALGLLREPFI